MAEKKKETTSKEKILGIDLGTTNSCISIVEGGKATVIPNAEGARTTPSVVHITKEDERVVGEAAKKQAIIKPKETVNIAFLCKRKHGFPMNNLNTNTCWWHPEI